MSRDVIFNMPIYTRTLTKISLLPGGTTRRLRVRFTYKVDFPVTFILTISKDYVNCKTKSTSQIWTKIPC